MEEFLDPQQDWRLGSTTVISAVSMPLLQSDELFWSHKVRAELCSLAEIAQESYVCSLAENE